MPAQIAVKIPNEMLATIDHLVETGRFASRSELVRAGLQRVMADDEAANIDRAFADGFSRHPDTDTDMRRTTRLAIESIDDEPWDPWW